MSTQELMVDQITSLEEPKILKPILSAELVIQALNARNHTLKAD